MTGIMGIIEDITEPKRLGERLRQVSRALKAITECHQALIRATNETELLNEVCRIIVEVGGYRMAWVGYAEMMPTNRCVRWPKPGSMRVMCNNSISPGPITPGAAGPQVRPFGWATGDCPGHSQGPQFLPLAPCRSPTQFSFGSGPPPDRRYPVRALTIYATEPNAFDDEEINLLLGLANDLAYGIMALRGRAEQRRAEEALKESEQELRGLTSQLLSIQEKRAAAGRPGIA